MKKSFQLSAVAIAIAASSSAIAGVSVNGSPSFGTINTTTVSINNLDTGNQVQTTMDDTGLTVDNKISTINPGNPGTPTSSNSIQLDLTGTPNTPVTKTGTVTQKLEGQQRTETTQVYDPNKVQFTSSDVIGDETTSITDIEITGQYDANGVLDASSVSATSTPQALPANPFTATSTNNQQELTLGRENTSEDYRLSITKTDNGVINTTTVSAAGISTNQITLNGQDLATTIANGDADTLVAANTYTDNQVAAEAAARVQGDADTLAAANTYTDNQIAVEAAARVQGDADTLAAANTYTDNQVAVEAAARVQGDADTLAAANTYTDGKVAAEKTARETADTAIRNDIATKVTTNSLEVNGPSNFNGPVTVNNVKATTTVDQAGTPATTPEFGADVNGDGRPDTLIQKKEQTDTVTVQSQTQAYNENNLTFTAKTEKGTLTTTNQYTADIIYDQNGVATYGPNASNGQTVTPDLQTVAEDSIIVGKETANSETALTVRSKDATGESVTTVTSKSVATGNITAKAITLDGQDLATTIANGDAATLTSAKGYTDTTATTLRSEAAAETVRVNKAIVDGDAATLASANTYTNATATTLRGEAAAETTRVNKAIADGNTATLASANTYTDSKAVETLATANSYTNARVNQLNSRVDDVEKTAYRGIAIALAAQQAIPSIQPGQIAVFGGVGHYEGETAGAVGLVGALNDRTSLSAALGFAGGNEVGGRVGVAYVFGGK